MKRKMLCLGLVLTISLIASCAAKSLLSQKNLNPKEQGNYKMLKKAGASKEDLEKYLLYHLTPTLESEKDSIWMEFWDRRYKSLTAEEQAVFYTGLNDSLLKLNYLSLKDEKERKDFIEKIKSKRKDDLTKSEEGRILYFSLKTLFSKEEVGEFLMAPDSLRGEWLRIWWKKKDPDLTTERNEFKEKFDQRVKYAFRNFHSIFGGKPWDDRGDIYILYGEPDGIERADYYYDSRDPLEKFRSLEDGKTTLDQIKEDMQSRAVVWSYFNGSSFQFQDNNATGYWELAPYKIQTSSEKPGEIGESSLENSRSMINFLAIRTEKVDMAVSKINLDLGEPLSFFCDWSRFWNEGDSYDLIVNLGVPFGKLGVMMALDSLSGSYDSTKSIIFTEKVALLDAKSMKTVFLDSATVQRRLSKSLNRKNLLFIDQAEFDSLKPGDYLLSVSVRDGLSPKTGIYQDTIILVPHVFAIGQEKISQILMVDSIWVAEKNKGKFIRNSLVIKPRPGSAFREGRPVNYYCELYELKAKNDSLNIRITYNILYKVKDDIFAPYARSSPERISWPVNSHPFLKGTLRNLPKGEYIIHIIVEDLNDQLVKRDDLRETAARFFILD